jgi:hypothetical protein
MPAMPARRAQRSAKLCEFHVKKPTGRMAPSSSKEPSTRQKETWPVAVAGKTTFELDPGCAIVGLRRTATNPLRE